MMPLQISLQLASKRPILFKEFVQNCEVSVDNCQNIEILVGVDDEDTATQEAVKAVAQKSKISIKLLVLNNPDEYFGLNRFYNHLFQKSSPDAYFHSIVTDELRFKTKGWDTKLLGFKSFFQDDIFRVRCSKYKLRNYFDFWECGYAPDSYAFHTRKWLEQGFGMSCSAGTPDAFQQFVSFYLQKLLGYAKEQLHREIPFVEFELEGETPYINISEKEKEARVSEAQKMVRACVKALPGRGFSGCPEFRDCYFRLRSKEKSPWIH